ncbi:MAG: diadenylate cyclase CdaA [Acholeplasmataceae bacterium]|nr:diadenylate cyclase CdaA [Acholeplasmataceae bacterium]
MFGVPIWKILIDFYIVWIVVFFVVKFLVKNKRVFNIALTSLFVFVLWIVSGLLDLSVSRSILDVAIPLLPLAVIVIMAPDLRRALEMFWKRDVRKESFVMGNERTKENIIDAALELSSKKTGALITIEKHNTLDQYAERAITMNADVTKEVLVNVFTPLSPLHDGAVIIRGDKILCAGAYFILSDNQNFDKTMGSRHRAGLGISEVSDSMTIIVSEETGLMSIAIEGIMLRINDREKLTEYVNMFMK